MVGGLLDAPQPVAERKRPNISSVSTCGVAVDGTAAMTAVQQLCAYGGSWRGNFFSVGMNTRVVGRTVNTA